MGNYANNPSIDACWSIYLSRYVYCIYLAKEISVPNLSNIFQHFLLLSFPCNAAIYDAWESILLSCVL